MNKIAAHNRQKIFGSPAPNNRRACKIIGRNKRPVRGLLDVGGNGNACDLWVWTDQPRRATQDVVARINLRQSTALDDLRAAGVVLGRME